jgi:hypothetical protein
MLEVLKTTLPAIVLFLIALPNADWLAKILGYLPGKVRNERARSRH